MKSTNRMAFLTTMPINMMIPNREKMLSVLPVRSSPPNAPTMATGSENMMARGCVSDSYKATISM